MTIRKGMMIGKGSGYKNVIRGYDSRIHSNSAKGMKIPQRMPQMKGVKMSKKDYEAFARIIGTAKSEENLRRRLQDYMAQDNPNFDANRFQAAIDKWKVSQAEDKVTSISKEMMILQKDIDTDTEGGQQLQRLKFLLNNLQNEYDKAVKDVEKKQKGGKSKKEYDVYLGDDGSLDTIVSVNGRDIRFDT
jgi:hypothetical protein